MGWLSTHILDTANGCPAADIALTLWRLETSADKTEDSRKLIKTVRTNQDGRTDNPLLKDSDFQLGTYEIVFAVGDYFVQKDPSLANANLFLDQIPLRFGIADVAAHYHVPLLVSPWSYSTYRGS